MSSTQLRVGLVGANPDGGWAKYAHIPALAALPEIELVAVATSRMDSAERAAAAYGARYAFASATDLAACHDVDLVAISVKAPMHFDTAMAAIKAGKSVFCEWPMGANLGQTRQLAEALHETGKRGFVGLQARSAPAIRHAKALIAQGYLGRLYGATMTGSFSYWGDPVATAYSADVTNGANILTIPGGHGLDVMEHVLGDPIARLSGWETHLRATVRAADTGSEVAMTAPDQFATVGALASGALFSAHFVGTVPHGEFWRLHLMGDKGELVLESTGMPEIAPVRLLGTNTREQAVSPLSFADDEPLALVGPALNVAYAWRAIARDMQDGGKRAADFADGAALRGRLDVIAQSHAAQGAPLQTDLA